VKQHPWYDCAYLFLPEDHWLRVVLAKDKFDEDKPPVPIKNPERFRDVDLNYYNRRPELISSDHVRLEGKLSDNYVAKKNTMHPSMQNGLHAVPLIMFWLTVFSYWLQIINDPMHIIQNVLDYILDALHGEGLQSSFTLNSKLRLYFDKLGAELMTPSQYRIPSFLLENRSHLKTGDKFSLCSEILIFMLSSTRTPSWKNSKHNAGRWFALFGLILCLNRLMCSSHTVESLEKLEIDLSFYITLLQALDKTKTFRFINFHLSTIFYPFFAIKL